MGRARRGKWAGGSAAEYAGVFFAKLTIEGTLQFANSM